MDGGLVVEVRTGTGGVPSGTPFGGGTAAAVDGRYRGADSAADAGVARVCTDTRLGAPETDDRARVDRDARRSGPGADTVDNCELDDVRDDKDRGVECATSSVLCRGLLA